MPTCNSLLAAKTNPELMNFYYEECFSLKHYQSRVNRTRIIQYLAKSCSQKRENVPHIIGFRATRARSRNKASNGVD